MSAKFEPMSNYTRYKTLILTDKSPNPKKGRYLTAVVQDRGHDYVLEKRYSNSVAVARKTHKDRAKVYGL